MTTYPKWLNFHKGNKGYAVEVHNRFEYTLERIVAWLNGYGFAK